MMEKFRVQASLLAITIIMTAAATAFRTASGAKYTVGKPGGSWDLQTNLTAWASTIAFHADDQLVFNYNASAHDVVEVTQAGYRACSATSPISAALRTGNDTVRLDGRGASRNTRYFICSTPGHCAGGMKLEVRVSDDDAECTNRLPRRRVVRRRASRCSGSPPVVNGAAPRSVAGLAVVAVSLLLGLAIV